MIRGKQFVHYTAIFSTFLQVSYADITFFDINNNILGKGKPEVPDHLNKYPKLVEHYKRVLDVPGIKAWLEKRPKTEM